jgi:hypothetical protein
MANSTIPLLAGVYRPDRNLGMLWRRLANGEQIPENALGLSASLRRPHHRLVVIIRDGKKPRRNQTFVWEIRREDGLVSMDRPQPL